MFLISAVYSQLIFLRSKDLLHLVEGRSGLEPFDLLLVERVIQGDVLCRAVAVLDRGDDGLKSNYDLL
jgi:hypothetical protein